MSLEWILKKLIFRPVKLKAEHRFRFLHEFTELTFHPHPNVALSAIHFKVDNPEGLLLYFHGNKGNLDRWGPIAAELTQFNYEVVAIDYRGYGKSTGEASAANLFTDAHYCYTKLITSLNPKKVIVYGRSLGTCVASCLAAQINPTMLILETPFYDMSDLIARYIPKVFYKSPFQLISNQHLINSKFPLLIIQGTKDRVVPFSHAKKLAESLLNPHVKFVQIDGGKHNNLSTFALYWDSLRQFIEVNGAK